MRAPPAGQALSGYVSHCVKVSQEASRLSTNIISVAFMGEVEVREMKYVLQVVQVSGGTRI